MSLHDLSFPYLGYHRLFISYLVPSRQLPNLHHNNLKEISRYNLVLPINLFMKTHLTSPRSSPVTCLPARFGGGQQFPVPSRCAAFPFLLI